ncbi:MAG: PD-(D/E)XK nuclease family protein [Saprospiraceae bacterium]|nr:PD-(D/E)XK nuclease family protein [Saprospiraceae bacterium]
MQVYFGLALDDVAHPKGSSTIAQVQYLGPRGLIHFLESRFGLTGHSNDNEYLRIEQYRQALILFLRKRPEAFFFASFQADQFATAQELLKRRDELKLAGWDFSTHSLSVEHSDHIPERLQCIAEVEAIIQSKGYSFEAGFADRFCNLLNALIHFENPIRQLHLIEPSSILPYYLIRLINQLENKATKIIPPLHYPKHSKAQDLPSFQQHLRKNTEKKELQGDGSLIILKAKRETDLAQFCAKLIAKNSHLRPTALLTSNSRTLDNALVQEGLPSLGTLSPSLARPTLQVLKLITVFLWSPIDPFKILEFVSLAIKPLDDELANRIAMQIAQRPGIKSDAWQAMIKAYFDEVGDSAAQDESIDLSEIRYQYKFWFERQRYDSQKKADKEDVIDIFNYLYIWAHRLFEKAESENTSLLVLAEQARRIKELLDALPEKELTKLELERIVRTIYEPSPIQFHPTELHHLPFVNAPNAIVGPIDQLLWWSFTQAEADHFFSRWYQKERTYLEKLHIQLSTPKDENTIQLWERKHPILFTQKQLILCLPSIIDGSEAHPHPLMGDLEANFNQLENIIVDVDKGSNLAFLEQHFQLPQKQPIKQVILGQPKAFIQIQSGKYLTAREHETISSLESLFYYPYQWVFRHKINLKKSSILEVVKDNALIGNLAHRFFERLLVKNIEDMDQAAIYNWVDQEANRLFEREGAVLLMYGREPQKINFLNKIKYAAWSLVNTIRENGWKVVGTEVKLEAKFQNTPINGRADLVLQRKDEFAVIDLKWRGDRRRIEIIKNEEDLQLVFYSRLLNDNHSWAHTAYFIIEKGKIIARNEAAFSDITPVSPKSDHISTNERILEKMQKTFQWRLQQVQSGQIEIRCTQTKDDLEEYYQEILMDMLEMKDEDAYYDDYRTLINLIH